MVSMFVFSSNSIDVKRILLSLSFHKSAILQKKTLLNSRISNHTFIKLKCKLKWPFCSYCQDYYYCYCVLIYTRFL